MAHANIYDPETNKWACWSTIVDDYITDWLPENEYRCELIADAIYRISDYSENSLINIKLDGNTATITIKDLSKFPVEKSDWYTKEECDARYEKIHGGSEE